MLFGRAAGGPVKISTNSAQVLAPVFQRSRAFWIYLWNYCQWGWKHSRERGRLRRRVRMRASSCSWWFLIGCWQSCCWRSRPWRRDEGYSRRECNSWDRRCRAWWPWVESVTAWKITDSNLFPATTFCSSWSRKPPHNPQPHRLPIPQPEKSNGLLPSVPRRHPESQTSRECQIPRTLCHRLRQKKDIRWGFRAFIFINYSFSLHFPRFPKDSLKNSSQLTSPQTRTIQKPLQCTTRSRI